METFIKIDRTVLDQEFSINSEQDPYDLDLEVKMELSEAMDTQNNTISRGSCNISCGCTGSCGCTVGCTAATCGNSCPWC